MERGGCTYILTNKSHSVPYIGVTSDLYSRIIEHRQKKYSKSFTSRYNVNKLVYFEKFHSIEEAIAREKQLKGGSRKKKMNLINSVNPDWIDLFAEIREW